MDYQNNKAKAVMNIKEELIQKAYELGFQYEKKYRGCAQCTIAAVFDALGIKNDEVFKAASGFSAGGGMMCDGICGGYSGGIMVMSLIFGRRRDFFDGDKDDKYCSFAMAQLLHDKFISKYNTVICENIHKDIFGKIFNLLDTEGKEDFEKCGAHSTKCNGVVAEASSWIAEILLNEIDKRNLGYDYLKREH